MAKEEENSAASLLAALGIGAGAYALTRKFRPSAIPKLRELQEAAEAGGASGYLPSFGSKRADMAANALATTIFGMPVNKPAAVRMNLFQDPNLNVKADHIINPTNILDELGGKLGFAKTAKDFVPKSESLKNVLREAGRPENIKRVMGGDYVVKPEWGSLEKLSDFAQHKDMLSKSAVAKKALANPDKYMIQSKLPSSAEYRVHMLDGQPYGISYRYLPDKLNEITKGRGGGLLPVFNRSKRQELSDFVQKFAQETKWGNLPKGEHAHAAFDILETPQGYKIIDANPSPATMVNPINSRQLSRLMTGRWGRDVSALAGIGAGGAAYTGMEAYNGR